MFKYKGHSSERNKPKSFLKYTGLSLGLFILLVLGLTLVPFSASSVLATSVPPPNQIILKLATGFNISDINASYHTSTVRLLDKGKTFLVSTTGQNAQTLVTQMSTDVRLTAAEINFPGGITYGTRISIYGQDGSALQNGGGTPLALAQARSQVAFSRMKLPAAQAFSSGAGIKIALLDTGVSPTHPDLAGKILPGYNFVNRTTDTADDNGHGTFVAGIITMVAPGALVMPVKVLNAQGAGTVADVVEGINWAVDNGAKIINLSLGLYTNSKDLEEAIKNAKDSGVLMIAAAGNDNSKNNFYPASWDGVMDVAGIDATARKANFSNYNKQVAVSAVGVGLYSTYYLGGYATGDGTSFSAPLVTGEAALIWSLSPNLRTTDLYNRIMGKANSIDQFNDKMYKKQLGSGEIDAFAAVLDLTSGAATSDPPPKK